MQHTMYIISNNLIVHITLYWLLYYTNTCIIYHYSTHMYHQPTTVHTCNIYHYSTVYPLLYTHVSSTHYCTHMYHQEVRVKQVTKTSHENSEVFHWRLKFSVIPACGLATFNEATFSIWNIVPLFVSAHIHAKETAYNNYNNILGSVMPYQNNSCNLQFIRLFHSYSWQETNRWHFKDPNIEQSNGSASWDECGGRQNLLFLCNISTYMLLVRTVIKVWLF